MNLFEDSLLARTTVPVGSLFRTFPLNSDQKRQAERLQELGSQAAKVAHDLNNMLSPVLMALEAFRPFATEAGYQAMLDIAKKSTLRASAMARDIMLFASGAQEQRNQIDAREIVAEIGAFIQTTFPRSLKIQVEAPHNLAPITANATQLHRALLNLCVNARDAMPEGGTLTLRASNASFGRGTAYVLFEIRDTGSGIPEAIREKIFDPFFTTKSAGKGTGLGLASVRSMVENHGGLLSLETEIGKGTTFHILLPAGSAGLSAAAAESDLPVVAA